MRINVYSQELTPEVFIVAKEGGFYGVRFPLHSSPMLHDTPEDDDRSAVTFWVASDGRTMDRKQFARVLQRAAHLLESDYTINQLSGLISEDISELRWPTR